MTETFVSLAGAWKMLTGMELDQPCPAGEEAVRVSEAEFERKLMVCVFLERTDLCLNCIFAKVTEDAPIRLIIGDDFGSNQADDYFRYW